MNDNIDRVDTVGIVVSVDDAASDDDLDSIPDQTVAVTCVDDDIAGIILSDSVVTVYENSGTDTFTVSLTSEPINMVVIDVNSANTDEATVAPASLTFMSETWNQPLAVTVIGVDDSFYRDDSTDVIISINTANSDDDAYNSVADSTVLVMCVDDDFSVNYVDVDAGGANDGSSWANAYTDLQAAIDATDSGDEVWVAEGTYYPTTERGGTGERYRTFQMKNGVRIYGGFEGIETIRDERDPAAHPVVLSGNIGTPGDNSDNCYHVFYHPVGLNLTTTAVLDGFTITGGNADGDFPHNYGGGMFND